MTTPKDDSKSPCLKCRNYKECPFGSGKRWYTYQEIRFCPFQVLFIIEKAGILGKGTWPPDPDGSSYVDPGIMTGFTGEAYFAKPIEILAEVELRLTTTKEAGEALIDEVQAGITNIEMLSRPAKRALMFTKGWRRKKQTYSQWKADTNYLTRKR